MYWNTADEIMEKNPDLAIIPIGSIEQHGPHLPVMTDWAIAEELGRRVQKLMGGFLLPALPISTCREQMGKKGSVWMEPPTFYQMMNDIIMSLKTQGFKRIALLPCHGGIFIMTPLVRDLNAKYNPDLMVAVASIDHYYGRLHAEGFYEADGELHAGEVETSQMLATHPETVHMERAVDCVPDVPRPYLSYGSIFRATESGVWGTPTLASAQKGEKIFARSAELAVEELQKAFAYMEKKETFGYSDF